VTTADVLVVGGGPAGAATAHWLARGGHAVTVVERRTHPRSKTCGDSLSPRAVHQLHEMGLADALAGAHRTLGVRVVAHDRAVQVAWPSHVDLPAHGLVVARRDLDLLVADRARAAGATILEGHEAVEPVVERGFVRGARVLRRDGGAAPIELRARYVVVADGANSRFGRAVGTFRAREWPYAMAARAYWDSPRHDEPWLETSFDLTDRAGAAMPGYGWAFPLGDGRVNVGVGVLSTYRDVKSLNTTAVLSEHAVRIADRWGIDPRRPAAKAAGGRIPLGGSVGPLAGPTFLIVGDAAAAVNPFDGDGLVGAFETARIAAEVVHEALLADDASVLQEYPRRYDARFGDYFKAGRLFARLAARPALMRHASSAILRSRALTAGTARIMTGHLRPDVRGLPEATYGAAGRLLELAPEA